MVNSKGWRIKKSGTPNPPNFSGKIFNIPQVAQFLEDPTPPPTPFNKGGRSSNYAKSEIPSINLTNAVKFLISTVNPTI